MGDKKRATKNIDAFNDGNTDFHVARGGPPGPALPGTRWVRGKDGWMLHESKDPDLRRA